MKLIDMLLKDPTISSEQKVIAVLQLEQARILATHEARALLLGDDAGPKPTEVRDL
jgi:hypothetical protein